MDSIIFDKISDVLCILGYGKIEVKFNVVLNKKDQKSHANNFYHEYEYSSNKYIEATKLRTIKRDFSYYLSFHFKDKSYLTIKPENMLLLRKGLDSAVEWFTDSKYEKLFIIQNDLLIVNKSIKINKVKIPAAYGKYMEISPKVIKLNDGCVTYGVCVSINRKLKIDLSLDDLYCLNYHMNELNMYQSAAIMINSLGVQEGVEGKTLIKIESSFDSTPPKSYGKSYGKRPSKPKGLSDL